MRLLTLSWIVAAAIVCANPALAAGPARCDAYAADAAKAALTVRKLACGFNLKDPRWSSSDPSVHNRWCRSASDDDVNQEQQERDADLNRCEVCRSYAKGAVAANRENIKYHCGFAGDRWGSSEAAHFNWCMAHATDTVTVAEGLLNDLKVQILDFEDGERADDLAKCKAQKKAKIDFCNAYVDETSRDAKYIANTQNNCTFKYEDGRYLGTDDVRFEWCFNLSTDTPGGDPNFKTQGQDPVAFLHEVAQACRLSDRARRVLHSTPQQRQRLQGFGGNASSGTPGGASSKLLAPGPLESDGGLERNAPSPTGSGTAKTGGANAGGSRNLR